jgi:UrcA family protein
MTVGRYGSQQKQARSQLIIRSEGAGNMSNRLIKVAVGLLAGISVNAIVIAQEMGEVTVQAARVVKKTIGTSASGVPIEDVSLSYGVSTKGLDLASSAGAMELQKRVTEAAKAACKELGRQIPASTPSDDAACAKAATAKAMVRANELITAAQGSGR